MVRRVLRGILAGIALAAVVMGAPALIAQSSPAQRQTPSADPSAALLAEVRALRAEIAEVSRISLRSQLLVARVQLQEQRIIHLDRRRAEVASRVAEASERTREIAARTAGMEKESENLRSGRSTLPATEVENIRSEIASQLGALRADLQAAQTQEQTLRAEEADITSGLAVEQGRWNDFNSRLDELERALPAR